MQFWKSLAIGLIVLLVISYIGFAYVYTQGGGITIAGMVTGGMQPKVVTLLKNSNVTLPWNTTVNVVGYRTGFFSCQQFGGTYCSIHARFEIDGIVSPEQESLRKTYGSSEEFIEVKMKGPQMWIIMSTHEATPRWAVISMSLYLRD